MKRPSPSRFVPRSFVPSPSACASALVLAAFVASLATSPASAADGAFVVTGVGELRTSYVRFSDPDGDVLEPGESHHLWSVGAGGSVDVAIGAVHVQADFGGDTVPRRSNADDTVEGSYVGGLHVGVRDPERGAIGLFGSAGKISIRDQGAGDAGSVPWSIGLEGAAFFDRATTVLQGGYVDRDSLPDSDPDALKNASFVRTELRLFPRDDVRLAGSIGLMRGRMDADDDAVYAIDWSAGAEGLIPGAPVSGFLRYAGAYFDQSDDNDVLVDHRIVFGLRYYFGTTSLIAHDRNGASFELPRTMEWNSVIAGPLE